ncbi:MAG: L,D-transpeptidase family protein [Candidatus Binatia bacterium]
MNSQLLTRTIMVVLSVWVATWVPLGSASAQTLSALVGDCVRARLQSAQDSRKIPVGKGFIRTSASLVRFYEQRGYQPAWSQEGSPLPQVHTLLAALREAGREGLNPADYPLAAIETLMVGLPQEAHPHPMIGTIDADRVTDLELLLTDAFLQYGSHLLASRFDPKTIDALWVASRRELDLAQVLQATLDTNDANQIAETLWSLPPTQPGYVRLRQALARYSDIAARGGWPLVPDGPKLYPGDRDPRIIPLRARLIAEGDFDPPPPPKPQRKARRKGGVAKHAALQSDLYDDPLARAVRRFQRRHGLGPDGTIGPATLAALNVSAQDRVQQIQLNLERWRWLPADLGPRHILVNVPNFSLEVIENAQPVLTMRAMVGKEDWRTPVFSAPMTTLVLNPEWIVPRSIATKEILPLVRQNPGYLRQQNIRVFVRGADRFTQVNPRGIQWGRVSAENFPYRFRQQPGPKNPLGRMKFLFPNQFSVYLHDTQATWLFGKATRALSHGCIRVEKPIELAEYVLRDDPRWTREAILVAIAGERTQSIPLPEAIPVHLLYWTAWVNDDLAVHFREDLYGRDKLLADALDRRRTAARPPVQSPAAVRRTQHSTRPKMDGTVLVRE